ncbi:MAG: hypothetical protein U0165_15780, partial [Polyangiaceae bacterium]
SLLLALGLLSTSATLSSLASAQPNPFTDYEAMKAGQPPPKADEPTAESDPVYSVKKGSMLLGGRTSFSYAGTSNDTPSGERSNSTFFFRLTPTFGYYVADRILVGGSLGGLWKRLARDSNSSSSESAWLFEVTGHYVVPLTQRFALAPGAGLGFYVGSSKIPLNGTDEATNTRGLAVALYVNAGYQVTQNLQLRSGLALFALAGSETVKSQDRTFSASAAHIGLPIEVFYTF